MSFYAEVFSTDELKNFVETSTVFLFNVNQPAGRIHNLAKARERMLRYLNQNPTLGPFIRDYEDRFNQLFPDSFVIITNLKLEDLEVYFGAGDDSRHYDNKTFCLHGWLHMYRSEYESSESGKAFEAWIVDNRFRVPVGFLLDMACYL